MSKISIKNAIKKYGDNTVISDLNVEIKDGELFTLLGASGCGKTTLLRMIAGFNSIEGGDFYFNETRINDMEPSKRNIGMVFQNYAIFPHLTVRENIAFGLKNRKYDKKKIQEETDKIMKAMQIESYGDRMPEKLSGGQQQRVALARALVIKPDVLLMDEPLSNLDAKLRVEMRQVIRDIQREVGITTVYVTHDQEEAMAISDTIAVMKDGVIQHLGSPRDIYQRPKNTFVASFIGHSNFLEADLVDGEVKLTDYYSIKLDLPRQVENGSVIASVRPEEFIIGTTEEPGIRGVVKNSMYLGLNTYYTIVLEDGTTVETIQESTVYERFAPDTAVSLAIKAEKFNLFDINGGVNLLRNDKDR